MTDAKHPPGRGAAPPDSREAAIARVMGRLDKPMAALGILFLLLVIGQALSTSDPLSTILTVTSWVLWSFFVVEFVLRAWLARRRSGEFWRRNWWQVVFLVVPFLRFARIAVALRAARAGGVVTAAVRSSRSAGRLLTDRLAWLAIITVSIILASGQLLVLTGSYPNYALALHDVALSVMSGEPLGANDSFSQVLELFLVAFSVVVFGTLAGALGAFFFSDRSTDDAGRCDGQRAEAEGSPDSDG